MSLPDIDLSRGTLIEIGAGTAPGLEDLLEGPGAPARVLLVEPHAATAKALAARFADFPQVTVLDVAVGLKPASGASVLRVANSLAHSSLYAPLPALRALLPGLRMNKPQPVEVVSGGEVLDLLGDLARPLHVRIDAPGSEHDILVSLQDSGRLEEVDSLDLRAGSEPLYEGSLGALALKDWLIQQGFLLNEASSDDPDWPEARLVVDRARRALVRKLAEAQTEATAQTQQIAQLAAVRKQLEGQLAQREAELASSCQDAEAGARRNRELEMAHAVTSKELEARTKALAESQHGLATATESLAA